MPKFRGPILGTEANGAAGARAQPQQPSAQALQTALEVSEPGDMLEQEAEQVAEQVMRMPAAGAPPPDLGKNRSDAEIAREMDEEPEEEPAMEVQRACAECSDDEDGEETPGMVQRACAECEEEEEEEEGGNKTMQRDAASGTAGAPRTSGGFDRALGAAQAGGGEPLPGPVRDFMEPRFGQGFGEVRVHRDSGASELARSVHAKAFTVGSDVFFKAGQFQPSTEQGQKLIAHELTHVVQQREGMRSVSRHVLQREAGPDAEVGEGARAGGLIVDDDVKVLTSGQARKSEFLSQLRSAVCSAADRELVLVGRDTKGCPVIERWLGHYAGRAASQLERAILKFVPEARRARSALEYIPIVAERVAKGVRKWALTGQIPDDIPPELRAEIMRGGDIGTMLAGAMSSIGGAISSAVSAVGSAIGGAVSAIGSLFFKAGPGGARAGADPAAIGKQLGTGRPLEGSTRSRMESALGSSLGDVRVHDDAHAAGLSRELGAHAFTVGEHVAFGAGNYRPGTPVGDALLAHELAHVVQQGGGATAGPAIAGNASEAGIEADADRAAAGALAALYSPTDAPGERRPRLRTGLSLSRCAGTKGATGPPVGMSPSPATAPPPESTEKEPSGPRILPPGKADVGTACDAAPDQFACVAHHDYVVNILPRAISNIRAVRTPYSDAIASLYEAALAGAQKAAPPVPRRFRDVPINNISVRFAGIEHTFNRFTLSLIHDPGGINGRAFSDPSSPNASVILNEASTDAIEKKLVDIEQTMVHETIHVFQDVVEGKNERLPPGEKVGQNLDPSGYVDLRDEMKDAILSFVVEMRRFPGSLLAPLSPEKGAESIANTLLNETIARTEAANFVAQRAGRDRLRLDEEFWFVGDYWDPERPAAQHYIDSRRTSIARAVRPIIVKMAARYQALRPQ